MELPEELKPNLHRTLLGPLSLATEIFGALLPGCVLTILVCAKRGWVTPVLSYSPLGYKTKIALAIFASYVAGKIVRSVVMLSVALCEWLAGKLKRRKAEKPKGQQVQNTLQVLAEFVSNELGASSGMRAFVGGLVGASILSSKSDLFQHYVAHEAASQFHLCTGVVFILGAAVPGDGVFRILEAIVGAVLLIYGITHLFESENMVAGMLGVTLNEYLSGLQPGQLGAGLKSGWMILQTLAKTPASATAHPTSLDKPAAPSAVHPTELPATGTGEKN
jgi:hypothetical protein